MKKPEENILFSIRMERKKKERKGSIKMESLRED